MYDIVCKLTIPSSKYSVSALRLSFEISVPDHVFETTAVPCLMALSFVCMAKSAESRSKVLLAAFSFHLGLQNSALMGYRQPDMSRSGNFTYLSIRISVSKKF